MPERRPPPPDCIRIFDDFEDYQKLSDFMALKNPFDKDETIQVIMRVRPMNDPELSVKEKRERSYECLRLHGKQCVVTMGKGMS